jgi:hypothetical protein
MKTVTVNTAAPPPTSDAMADRVAGYLAAYLFGKSGGALYGRWDEGRRRGVWFYSADASAMFAAPRVDDVLFEEEQRWRFRSVIFRLGSLASETAGDLCGVMKLVPADARIDPGPPRRYVVHASFRPEAGLWLKATVVADEAADDVGLRAPQSLDEAGERQDAKAPR